MRRMTKRPAREKRQRIPSRASRARIHYIKPDHDKPQVVKVYVAVTRRHMRATVQFIEREDNGLWCMGQVWSWSKGPRNSNGPRKRPSLKHGRVVARMYLNVDDLRSKPSEIVSHECTHAGMAWARWRKAKLADMVGEEVLCYAVGRMTDQVNRIGFMMGIWP